MHQLVLDGNLENSAALGERVIVRTISDRLDSAQEFLADPVTVLDDLNDRRPLGKRLVPVDSHRVNPALEKRVEFGPKGGHTEHPPADLIPGERRQVPEVEDQRMSEGNRLLVEGTGLEKAEYLVGARPTGAQSLND